MSVPQGAFLVGATLSGRLVTVADYNADKHADLLLLDDDATTLRLHTYVSQGNFEVSPTILYSATSSLDPSLHNQPILNVVPADFNYDGDLDLLLTLSDPLSSLSHSTYLHAMLFHNSTAKSLFSTLGPQQPLLVDYQGRMNLDFLGYQATSSLPPLLSCWKSIRPTDGSVNNQPLFDLPVEATGSDGSSSVPFCTLSHPHSSAFVDFNGDCHPDIFLTCLDPSATSDTSAHSYQIWIQTSLSVSPQSDTTTNGSPSQFRLLRHGPLPTGIGAISFADMNADGTIDAVFPVCTSDKDNPCSIHIVYNIQVPLCARTGTLNRIPRRRSTTSNSQTCRSLEGLCEPDNDFVMNFEPARQGHLVIPLKQLASSTPYFVQLHSAQSAFHTEHPVPLRIGDYNLDGYPDLLAIVSSSSSTSSNGANANGKLLLLRSVPCKPEICSADAAIDIDRRTFIPVTKNVEALTSISAQSSVLDVTWLDVGNDGTLDIIAIVQNQKSQEITSQIILNRLINDAFFMKTLVLNPVSSIHSKSTQQSYGAASLGATFKFSVIDTTGRKKAVQILQLYQTSYTSLHTPYTHVGLGRTNNYIEEMYVGVSTQYHTQGFYAFQGIIPNSQLVVIPTLGEMRTPNKGETSASGWKLELFVNPGSYAILVLVTLLGTFLLLSVVVSVLHVFERREDERERRKALHIINYDAL